MIRIRRGVVREIRVRRKDLLDVDVEIDGGSREPAVAYPGMTGPIGVGDRVVLNTSAVALGLGTGGVHFVIAVEAGADTNVPPGAAAVKLRYTPSQVVVAAIEESGTPLPEDLDGLPVVAAGLHSAVAAVAIGVRSARDGARVAFVMTDGGALPIAFSDTVAEMRDAGLLASTVTCGHAFGGDLEAVNVFSGLLAARASGCDVAVVAMGPGNLGTGSRYGFATMEVAEVVNAAAALGGTPIVVPRVGFADARPRHRAVSHHTITALADATFASALVPVALPETERTAAIRAALAPLARAHRIVDVDLGAAEEAVRNPPVRLSTMGRGPDEEPEYFRAAAAAGVLAAGVSLSEG